MGAQLWSQVSVAILLFLNRAVAIAPDAFLDRLNGMHKAVVNENYDASVIPWRGPEVGPVVVNSSLHLQQVVRLNEKEQILTSKVFVQLEWIDPRLQWDPSEHQGVEYIRLPSHMLWRPDIIMENSASETMFLSDLDSHSLIRVSYRGEVQWVPYLFLDTFCQVDATFFPFDQQTCPYKLSSYFYPHTLIRIDPVFGEINIAGQYSAEWDVKDIVYSVHKSYETSDGTYFHCNFSIVISRRMNFSNLVMLIPCVILTVLTLMMFILPAETGQRMELGLAIWTSLVLFLLIVNDTIPGSSDGLMPIVGTYLILMVILVTLSLIIVILNTVWQEKHFTDLPKWLQRLISSCPEISTHTNAPRTNRSVSRYVDRLSVSVQISSFVAFAIIFIVFYAV